MASRVKNERWISAVFVAAVSCTLVYDNLEWFAARQLQIAGINWANHKGETLHFFIFPYSCLVHKSFGL